MPFLSPRLPNGLHATGAALTIDSARGLPGGMSAEPHLLIAWHSRTGTAEALAAAAADGAQPSARLVEAAKVQPDDLLAAHAYLFVAPENLAALSGEMKEMFDRCYYSVLGRIEGRAYATIIAAGSDGEGAQRQIDRIATGWRLRRVAEPILCRTGAQTPGDILARKIVGPEMIVTARNLGAAIAEGLRMGIY